VALNFILNPTFLSIVGRIKQKISYELSRCLQASITTFAAHMQLMVAISQRMGRGEEALGMLNDVLAQIERREQAEMLRIKGEMLLMRDSEAMPEAERCFRAALEIARAQEAKWWELLGEIYGWIVRASFRRSWGGEEIVG
jgi:hypothetical protein